jgi:hypothetical protein
MFNVQPFNSSRKTALRIDALVYTRDAAETTLFHQKSTIRQNLQKDHIQRLAALRFALSRQP